MPGIYTTRAHYESDNTVNSAKNYSRQFNNEFFSELTAQASNRIGCEGFESSLINLYGIMEEQHGG